MAQEVPTSPPMQLVLQIEKEVEIDGVGMGVLSDGTPYLTGRGLARMCGVDPALIRRMAVGWDLDPARPREAKIKDNLRQQGAVLPEPYIRITKDGVWHHAYPDIVCMAVLEYYAFDSASPSREHASRNYRLLARRSFREFIYTQIGYSPRAAIPLEWRQFHDRVTLVYGSVPAGTFASSRKSQISLSH